MDAPGFSFTAPLFEWRGPAPYWFVRVPDDVAEDLAELGPDVTYGWGMIPVEVSVGDQTWETSLWPKNGGYLVPIRVAFRKGLGLTEDQPVAVELVVATRDGRLVTHDPTDR